MDLSNNLISQFAKLTTGDKDKNKETTVYGTVKIYDGKTCVKLDGSDLLTPVDTTTEVKEGQRVAVLVKNHSAVIMGNTSDPSAGLSTTDGITEDVGNFKRLTATNFTAYNATIENLKATKAEIEDLEATNAIVENLKVTKAEIKDLEAANATIENLKATKAEIKDLEATNASIQNLQATKADILDLDAVNAQIGTLQASKADIADLNAANAEITNLDTELANIQTLVNGNLTSDNIASLNLTSSNTTIQNAMIKDAMIDNLTASKLTAGVIDTDVITIKSNDGSMLLTGSIQQFKDENGKVRIQIGKDGGGNFTFVLYDETGNGVLIDENGIKSSDAIADGLIVDAKVAGNANISGSKLNINSVITEVNNNKTTTIKSNKIYLDEEGQSLDVAFNKMQTSVDNNTESIKTNTTALNTQNGKINTLISENEIRQNEIENLDGKITSTSTEINNKYTILEQNLEGFRTSVSETYTTKTEFNNLNVGGRNYASLSNFKTYHGGSLVNPYQCYTINGTKITATDQKLLDPLPGFKVLTDGNNFQFTVSGYTDLNTVEIYTCCFDSSGAKVHEQYWINAKITNGYFTATLTHIPSTTSYINIGVGNIGVANYFIDKVKIEKGNKATDWSPAPEDIDADINDLANNLTTNYSTTSQMNSAINQKANEITTSVSETYTTKSEFNNLNVGGRNLLSVPNETTVYSATGESGKDVDVFNMMTNIIPTGTEYIVSFEAKASANMTCLCYFYNPNTTLTAESSTENKHTSNDGSCSVNITTSWKRYWVKWTQTAPDAKKRVIVGRNRTNGVTLEIRAVKFEEGNKPTAWSPAPELATNSINNLSTRVTNAESKLTKNSLTTTIGDYYTTKNDVESYGYATTSQVQQTKDEWTATFKSSGGHNLIRNSTGYGGIRGWNYTSTLSTRNSVSSGQIIGTHTHLCLTNTGSTESFAVSPRFELKPNTKYTFSGWFVMTSAVKGYDVFCLTSDTLDWADSSNPQSYKDAHHLINLYTNQLWQFVSVTFTTTANAVSGYIRVDNNGYTGSGSDPIVYFGALMLNEGSIALPWSPHPSEAYSSTTQVDKDGVKVTHSKFNGYTQMSADGFYLNDGSKNVLSITSSGASFNMPISANSITSGSMSADRIYGGTINGNNVNITNLNASNITSGKISGDFISGGTISAAKEINFAGGARIFGNQGETGAGLMISAGSYNFSGASIGNMGGNWTIGGDLDVGDTLTVEGGCSIGDDTTISGKLVVDSTMALDYASLYTPAGTASRDYLKLSNGILTYDSSSGKFYAINAGGNFIPIRGSRFEAGGDITCWDLWASNKVYANNVALSSDKRLKTDIRYVNKDSQSIGESGLMSPNVNITTKDMLEFIETIPFASYRMKNEVEKDIDYTYYGFIAQDLLETKVGSELIEYSEVIIENKSIDEEGRELVEYTTEERLRYSENKFIAFLAGAVQEDIIQRKAADKKLMEMLNGIINE